MAIVFTGSTTTAGGTQGTITCNKPTPAGSATGDLLVAQLAILANQTVVSTGWTSILNSNDGSVTVATLYKIVDGTEPSSFTFTWNSQVGHIGISRFSGTHATTPIHASGAGATVTTSGADVSAPSVTTTIDNAYVMRAYGCAASTGGSWTITGATSNWSFSNNLLNAGDIKAIAGASGAQLANFSGGGARRGQTIALAPFIPPVPPSVPRVGMIGI